MRHRTRSQIIEGSLLDVVTDLDVRMRALEAARPAPTVVAACDRITTRAIDDIEKAMRSVARALDAIDAVIDHETGRAPARLSRPPAAPSGERRRTRPPSSSPPSLRPGVIVPFTRPPKKRPQR